MAFDCSVDPLALTGCTVSTVPVGENGLRVRAGEWLGKNDKGSAMLAFNIVDAGDAGGNVVLLTYAYPCGERIRQCQLVQPERYGFTPAHPEDRDP